MGRSNNKIGFILFPFDRISEADSLNSLNNFCLNALKICSFNIVVFKCRIKALWYFCSAINRGVFKLGGCEARCGHRSSASGGGGDF